MGWLDLLVAVAWTGFWAGLAVLMLVEGGTAVQACLALVIAVAGLFRWLRSSWTLETLLERRRPRGP